MAETCTGLEQGVALEVIVSLHCSCTLSHVLFFPQLAIGLHCMLTAHVRTEAYSSAKINECIDFVELNRTTLWWPEARVDIVQKNSVRLLSLAASDKPNHNSCSTQ